MKHLCVFFLTFMLAGCIFPHKSPYSMASAFVNNDKICVYVSTNNFVSQEKILSITVYEYGQKQELFTKNYLDSNSAIVLIPEACIKDLSSFSYEMGKGYVVLIRTPLHLYESKFIVWNVLGKVAIKMM